MGVEGERRGGHQPSSNGKQSEVIQTGMKSRRSVAAPFQQHGIARQKHSGRNAVKSGGDGATSRNASFLVAKGSKFDERLRKDRVQIGNGKREFGKFKTKGAGEKATLRIQEISKGAESDQMVHSIG